MKTQELGGNILLQNFDLDGTEMVVVRKLVGKYAEKIRHFTQYDELKLEMKSHKKGKNKQFEIKALLSYDKNLAFSEAQGLNVFVLIDDIMKKVLQEVEQKIKK